MVNADNTAKEETERSESMRHFVVKSVLKSAVRVSEKNCKREGVKKKDKRKK